MTDPTNPGDTPDTGVPPPPPSSTPTPPPSSTPAPPPPPPATTPAASASFPPPTTGTGFPPPTQTTPAVGTSLGPPPGPTATQTTKSKGPLIAVLAVGALLIGALAYFTLGRESDDKDVAADRTTTTEDGATTTDKSDGPGGKEGTADEGEKEDEQPEDTASGDAQGYGDDPALDALYDQCEEGDFQACDDLYKESGFGTEYEEFGDTCGNRNEPSGYCVDVYSDGGDDGTTDDIDGSGAMSYGDNAQLDVLYDQCEEGDFQACDTLYAESDFGSEYEEFGDTCGNRNEPAGYCVDVYSDDGGG